jgi:hypothetical protein
MLFVLYPLHVVLDTEAKKTRRYIRKHHRVNHATHARWCREEDCKLIRTRSSTQSLGDLSPVVAVTDSQP